MCNQARGQLIGGVCKVAEYRLAENLPVVNIN